MSDIAYVVQLSFLFPRKREKVSIIHRSKNIIIFCLWVVVIDKVWSERVKFGPKNPKMVQKLYRPLRYYVRGSYVRREKL